MTRRLRRALIRWLRTAVPALPFVGALCAAGLGLHAAEDWHRHGEVGAGFFHLHFHVGDHHHDDHERAGGHHPETSDTHHGHEPDTRDQNESPVFTIVQAVPDPGPTAPDVAAPEAVNDTKTDTQIVVAHQQGPSSAANPRAPPA